MEETQAPKRGGAGAPDITGLYSLKIDSLDYSVTLEQLRDAFAGFGEVGDVHIPRDHLTKRSRGFGFVRFKERQDAEASV